MARTNSSASARGGLELARQLLADYTQLHPAEETQVDSDSESDPGERPPSVDWIQRTFERQMTAGLDQVRREIGRGREQFAPRRIGAGDRFPFRIRFDRGLQFSNREQRRRNHRGGDAAAARPRSFR